MMQLNKIVALFSAVVIGRSCTNLAPKPDYSNYVKGVGEVTYVYGSRVGSHGYIGRKYRVRFVPEGQTESVMGDAKFWLKAYEKGDSLVIYYNPKNLEDVVTDKID
ncbi:MAG: hypothetical protein DI598_04045 [Pseudopedobacter saltans]|uniref:DUF3592 domain-containing protein n=1 Tax=Pseudopedobacter saltans TaxID=151895 RepID=A0A2W5HBP1_9SPHI|nr:MAG: hypothetical protein DI598_04045 [Pseudopedobacter saltans]